MQTSALIFNESCDDEEGQVWPVIYIPLVCLSISDKYSLKIAYIEIQL